MPLRTSTATNYARLLMGLRYNQARLLTGQEQSATGLRILRPSDDPAGAARTIALTRHIAGVAQHLDATRTARDAIDHGGATLEGASALLTDARELLIQGMNGTLSQDDRDALASQLIVLRDELLDTANAKWNDEYVFGGTASKAPPWVEVDEGGLLRVVYAGDEGERSLLVSEGVEVAQNIPGSDVFGKAEYTGLELSGLTGLAAGDTADEGSGYEYVVLRHDATDAGALAASGVALVGGGAGDTLLGTHDLVIDPAAGTVQLGDGPVYQIPNPADPGAADFSVANGQGGLLHLDFSGYAGAAFSGPVTGEGSISIDGASFAPLSFTETDLELKNPATGSVLHVDTTTVGRAGTELASFGGANNVFDALQGAIEDLQNGDGLTQGDIVDRLNLRLDELDRNADNVRVSLSVLGSRSARLQAGESRLTGEDVRLQDLRSETRDADLAEAVTTMVKAQQTLQIAGATGMRLIQTSLLSFLR
jgi:flagellar hook-associated protein 3 FlgL